MKNKFGTHFLPILTLPFCFGCAASIDASPTSSTFVNEMCILLDHEYTQEEIAERADLILDVENPVAVNTVVVYDQTPKIWTFYCFDILQVISPIDFEFGKNFDGAYLWGDTSTDHPSWITNLDCRMDPGHSYRLYLQQKADGWYAVDATGQDSPNAVILLN